MLDHAAVERAEKSIDEFINARSKGKEEANELAEMWAASERRHQEKRRRENVAAWKEFHLRTAEGLERTAASLAADHRARAEALGDEEIA